MGRLSPYYEKIVSNRTPAKCTGDYGSRARRRGWAIRSGLAAPSGFVRWLRLGLPAKDVTTSGPSFRGGLDDLHVAADDPVEHRARIDHRTEPTNKRETAPDDLAVMRQQRQTVTIFENEFVARLVEWTAQVIKGDAFRGV